MRLAILNAAVERGKRAWPSIANLERHLTFSVNLGHLDLRFRLVVSASARFDGVQIVVDPEVKSLEGAQSSMGDLCQFVLDTRRHFGKIVTHNKAVALEIAQRERQHALGDLTDLFSQGRKAKPMTFRERKTPKNRHSPFVAQQAAYPV